MCLRMTCIEGGGEASAPRRNERRRSSCVRRDPDDILRSLRAVKGELGRTLSLSGSTARRKYCHLTRNLVYTAALASTTRGLTAPGGLPILREV